MSVIQTIRNKYIGLVVGAIVVALIGFLVMDAMQSNVRTIFSGDQTLMADINGTRVEYKDFAALQTKYEENIKARQNEKTLSDEERTQAGDQAWTDIVNETLVNDESEKLGIDLTDKELQDMLTGPYADPMVQQSFSDPNTGMFDPSRVSQYLSNLSQDKTGVERAKWKDFEEAIIKQKKIAKYNDLITKGIYIPKFVLDRTAKENSSNAAISYVQIPYSNISDSTIKITDADINDYMKKNEKLFTTLEPIARAEYVTFDIIPSAEDTAASLGVLNGLKEEFVNTTDNEEFVAKNSEESMRDLYYNESTLQAPNPAEVINSAVGAVVGPFYMQDGFKMMKVIAKKQMPDSVKASHILVAINEQRSEDQAKASIDSIEAMIKAGADFAQVAVARTDDKGSAAKGGDLGYFAQGMMVPEFNDVAFSGVTGDLKVVKTQFGYHLIKITDQKDFKPAVKLAVITKALTAGNTTTQAAFAKANDFVTKAKDAKAFDATAKAMGKDKRIADRITPTQKIVQGLGSSRDLTRWMYEAKIGAVSPIFNLDDKLVIATLQSRIEKGGMPDLEGIRPQLENILRREKKAQMIADKFKGKSLEEIAAATNTQVMNADTLNYQAGNAQLASEPKVIGAAFNKANLNKTSTGIGGEQGVYFVSTKSVTEGTALDPTMQFIQRRQMTQQLTSQATQMIAYVLKRNAKIEDRRGIFF